MPAGDPYFDQVQLLLHAEGSGVVDSSAHARTVAQTYESSTIVNEWGSRSELLGLAFFASGYATQGLAVSDAALAPGTADLTYEQQLYPSDFGHTYSGDGVVFQLGDELTPGSLRLVSLTGEHTLELQAVGELGWTSFCGPTAALADTTWRHVAVTRAGDTWSIWIEGALAATAEFTVDVAATDLWIHCTAGGGGGYSARFDELRYTVGVARYTAAFSPASTPFPDRPPYWSVSVTDGVTVGWEGLAHGAQLDDALDDDLALAGTLAQVRGIQWSDSYRFADTPNTTMPARAVDTVRARAFVARALALVADVVDHTWLGDPLAFASLPGAALREGLRVGEVLQASARLQAIGDDRVRLAPRVAVARSAALGDAVGLGEVLQLARGLRVLERLGLGEDWVASARMGLTHVEQLRLVDALRRFLGGEAADTVTVGSTVAPALRRAGHAADTVSVADLLARQLVLRVTATGDLGLEDAQWLRAILRPELRETVEIAAAFVSPAGGVTTWAINVATGAVSEYGNFAFNSFAQAAHHYLGAARSGLYRLDGDTDAGALVEARVRSGLLQMAGSRHTQFRGAYLGLRAEGEFVLRLVTGDGEAWDYAFDADAMRTSRVVLGRGLRARYFAFELLSTGQDFDLDAIEFVPIANARRV